MKPERWARLGELFHEALEREPGGRVEFLREACAGDESLRREVEALLARHAEAADFLASPALEVEAQALAGELAAVPAPPAGSASQPPIATGPPSRRLSRRSRPPWWMYALAALFLCDWLLRSHALFLGPRGFDFTRRWEEGRWLVAAVPPESASERAGFRAGDILVALDGRPLESPSDWRVISPNLETGRTYRFDIARGEGRLEVAYTMERARVGSRWIFAVWEAEGFLLLATGIFIGFARPRDSLARLGALALASLSLSLSFWTSFPPGGAVTWRALPAGVAALLLLPKLCSYLVGPIILTFFATFPRPLVRARWPWAIVWLPALCLAPLYLDDAFLVVYRPAQALANLVPEEARLVGTRLYGLYGLLSVVALAVNYFRLTDLNDRRRLRVLFIGGAAAVLPGAARLLIWRSKTFSGVFNWLGSGVPDVVLAVVFVLFPACFAYSILRHRLLDIRLIIRQGLQYAAARGVLLSAVPVLGFILVADLLVHGDQPLIRILQARGWAYAGLGTLAVAAHSQRRRWGEALDRRFFRERYDARQLLHRVAAETARARTFADAAPGVVTRVEAALHSRFAAVMDRPPDLACFRTVASSPADNGPPPIAAESSLISVVRTLGDPLDVLLGESGSLRFRLPEREIGFVRSAGIDLIVPIAVAPAPHEALLALGAKQSEEPYTRDDRDMLAAIAANLELLLERPAAQRQRAEEGFAECPACGACFDRGVETCVKDGARLVTVHGPRVCAGRYKLERRLGSGGMGAVYEAADSALQRRVALKVIREDRLGSAEAVQRFQREARAAAGFPHPNVVTVYDYGIEAGTRAFLVMELLEGATLRDELRARGRLDAASVTRIFRGLCSAVGAAHARQLIHRDLKPENIYLARTGGGGTETVKVLDFGIAKFLPGSTESAKAANPAETAVGVLVGTPGYLSPEQLLGEEAAFSWDLWALAVTAYESLTGMLPFPPAGTEGWRSAVLAGRHLPLARHLADPLPAAETFFVRALAPDRAARPASAAEFLLELEKALGASVA